MIPCKVFEFFRSDAQNGARHWVCEPIFQATRVYLVMNRADTATAANSTSSQLWLQILRLLFFCANRDDLSNLSYKHLAAGLLCTWIVGMGRYWDDPCAYPMQHLGLGSVFYVFILSLLLWLVILPLRPAHWSYRQVLTYVTLTSPPAIIYAIPVEHFLSMKDATNANLYFLIIVAVWRVALMAQYLRLAAQLPLLQRLVGMLFPVTTVITLLFLLDQHRAVFQVMGGFKHHLNPREGADIFLNEVVGCSLVVCPLAAVCYFVMLCWAWRKEVRRLACSHKFVASSLSLCLVGGITYGAFYCMSKSPSDELCDKATYPDSPQEGEALCTKAILLDPNNARAFCRRASLEERDGRYLAALADCNRAIALDRSDGSYLLQRAFLLQELGRPADALNDLRDARKTSTAISILGAVLPFTNLQGFESLKDVPNRLATSSDWQSMQSVFWQVFDDLAWLRMPHDSIDRENSWGLIEEVPILWQVQRLKEALEDCNSLVNQYDLAHGSAPASSQSDGYVEDSALARAYRMRGYTYELLGQNVQALSGYESALAVVKDDQRSLFLKARLLKKFGRESEAYDTFMLVRKAVSNKNLGASSHYIELLTLAELGKQKEAPFRLITEPPERASKDSGISSVKKASALRPHVGDLWSEGYADEDYNLPAKLWETGKFYQLLGIKTLAREQFLAAIAWMDKQSPKPGNKLNVLLWRTRLFLSLGDKDRAAEAFQQARVLGYAGSMPIDDLSSIDARLLVMGSE